MKDKINVDLVLQATAVLQNEADRLANLIGNFGANVTDNLNSVWQSENANRVHSYLDKMQADLNGINDSIINIKENVNTFANTTSSIDDVNMSSQK